MPLVTDEIYHVFNRGINRQPTFTDKREYQRAIDTLMFYRHTKPPLSLSKFLRLENDRQSDVLKLFNKSENLVKILCYCLMPNHFHLLLKQGRDNGISKFLSNMQNSYTRYFNTKHDRDGSLFLDQFKAIRIETDEQLVHVSRYIHLNPYTAYLMKSHKELEDYHWSSFHKYTEESGVAVDTSIILGFFRDRKTYKKFVYDQADYQRNLKKIEHLLFE